MAGTSGYARAWRQRCYAWEGPRPRGPIFGRRGHCHSPHVFVVTHSLKRVNCIEVSRVFLSPLSCSLARLLPYLAAARGSRMGDLPLRKAPYRKGACYQPVLRAHGAVGSKKRKPCAREAFVNRHPQSQRLKKWGENIITAYYRFFNKINFILIYLILLLTATFYLLYFLSAENKPVFHRQRAKHGIIDKMGKRCGARRH